MTATAGTTTLTFDDLSRIITASAGIDDGVQLTPLTQDIPLNELGYDSLAMLETVSRIEREFGLTLDESAASADLTAAQLLATVNEAV